jgi:tRNA-dihydrouridine synthase B
MNNTFWQETFTIGNLVVPRFMAAPLDGLTDSPFRQLMRRFSPTELLFTEMRHVGHIAHAKDGIPFTFAPDEQPLAFQFSANANVVKFIDKALQRVLDHNFVMINLNCGCPAKTVIKSLCGSALMADPTQLETIMKQFMISINGRVPFTVKMRAGFKTKNALDIAKRAQDCGAAAVIIHPRTQPEGFAARLDFELVYNIKKSVQIPVVFSGNINSFQSAQKTYQLTGVDGFMIGRALWGCPWKIREITDAASEKTFTVLPHAIVALLTEHLTINTRHYGPKGFVVLKKHIPLYVRSLPSAATWRQALLLSQSEPEMHAILKSIIEELNRAAVS